MLPLKHDAHNHSSNRGASSLHKSARGSTQPASRQASAMACQDIRLTSKTGRAKCKRGSHASTTHGLRCLPASEPPAGRPLSRAVGPRPHRFRGGGSSTHVENVTLSSVGPETWHAVEEAGDSEGLIQDNLEPDDADRVACIFDEEAQRCVTPKSILLAQIIYLFSIWSSASSLFWESTNCRRRKEGRKEGRKE